MKKRNSSIELLKIIAMILIAINQGIQSTDLLIGTSTTDLQLILLTIFRCCGNLGNVIFIICSVYFLLNSNRSSSEKAFSIIFDSFFISIIWFGVHFVLDYPLSMKDIIRQIFPLTFNNNWFIFCYLFIYILHPFFNKFIFNISKVQLFRLNIIFLFLYSFVQLVLSNNFYYNNLIGFVVIYFFVAFFKLYLPKFNYNLKLNLAIVFLTLILNSFLILAMNYAGLYIDVLSTRVLHSNYVMTNPIYLLFGISIFNVFNKFDFHNKFINSISSLSLLFYLIHENDLFRMFLRKDLFKLIYINDFLFLNTLVLSFFMFICAICLAFVYKQSIGKFVNLFSRKVFLTFKKVYLLIENNILKITI